jgi:hypothetical protein
VSDKKKKGFWSRFFGRKSTPEVVSNTIAGEPEMKPVLDRDPVVAAHLIEAITTAITEQERWEEKHPVKYAVDQRARALIARCRVYFGAALPDEAIVILNRTAKDWENA